MRSVFVPSLTILRNVNGRPYPSSQYADFSNAGRGIQALPRGDQTRLIMDDTPDLLSDILPLFGPREQSVPSNNSSELFQACIVAAPFALSSACDSVQTLPAG